MKRVFVGFFGFAWFLALPASPSASPPGEVWSRGKKLYKEQDSRPFTATPLGQGITPNACCLLKTTSTPNSPNGGYPGHTRSGGTKFHGGLDDPGGRWAFNKDVRYYGTAPGKVLAVGQATDKSGASLGVRVKIEMNHGGHRYESKYLHMYGSPLKVGDQVQPGQIIGHGAGAGDQAKGAKAGAPHVHWEVRRDGALVNPVDWQVLQQKKSPPSSKSNPTPVDSVRENTPSKHAGSEGGSAAWRKTEQGVFRTSSNTTAPVLKKRNPRTDGGIGLPVRPSHEDVRKHSGRRAYHGDRKSLRNSPSPYRSGGRASHPPRFSYRGHRLSGYTNRRGGGYSNGTVRGGYRRGYKGGYTNGRGGSYSNGPVRGGYRGGYRGGRSGGYRGHVGRSPSYGGARRGGSYRRR